MAMMVRTMPGNASDSPGALDLVAGAGGHMGATLAAAALGAAPAQAVNANHGNGRLDQPRRTTRPHVMNGSVNAITQIGNKIIAAGTFSSVSPRGTFANTGDDVVRNRIFAFDATTGRSTRLQPRTSGRGQLARHDGTSIYVGGAFGSVGGNTTIKRVVKLSVAGVVDTHLQGRPDSVVSEVVVRSGRVYIGGAFTSVKRGHCHKPAQRPCGPEPSHRRGAVRRQRPLHRRLRPRHRRRTNIKRFDVSADGSRLAAIGNFSTVGGQPRSQLAVLDTSGSATVAPWATNRFDSDHNDCAGVFDTFTRDIDFSPNGDFFVVTSTGAFAGGAYSGTLCDTATRWETASTGNDPTWTNYTGGDTLYGVAITGGAVYIGGHQRWHNNSFSGDNAGPGRRPAGGHRRARPGQRPAVVLEPGPHPGGGGPGALRKLRRPLDRQ
jgi:hypothetical protein